MLKSSLKNNKMSCDRCFVCKCKQARNYLGLDKRGVPSFQSPLLKCNKKTIMTERQKMLLEIAIENLNNVSSIIGVEEHTQELDYDGEEGDLSTLAEDLQIEFNL